MRKKTILKAICVVSISLLLSTSSILATTTKKIDVETKQIGNELPLDLLIIGLNKTQNIKNEDFCILTFGPLGERNSDHRIPLAYMTRDDLNNLQREYVEIIQSKEFTSYQKTEHTINLFINYGLFKENLTADGFNQRKNLNSGINPIINKKYLGRISDNQMYLGPTVIIEGSALGQFNYYPIGPPLGGLIPFNCTPLDKMLNNFINITINPLFEEDISVDLQLDIYGYLSYAAVSVSGSLSGGLVLPTLYPNSYFDYFAGPVVHISIGTASCGFFFYGNITDTNRYIDPIFDVSVLLPFVFTAIQPINYSPFET